MTDHPLTTDVGNGTTQTIDKVAWGLLLIWIGIALFANFGWGIGILGVGIIVLGEQLARKHFARPVEIFWLIVGIVFVIGGISELLRFHISLIPLACIAAGVALLASASFAKKSA